MILRIFYYRWCKQEVERDRKRYRGEKEIRSATSKTCFRPIRQVTHHWIRQRIKHPCCQQGPGNQSCGEPHKIGIEKLEINRDDQPK